MTRPNIGYRVSKSVFACDIQLENRTKAIVRGKCPTARMHLVALALPNFPASAVSS
jgi:hypothetical protein